MNESRSGNARVNLDLVQVLNLGCNILQQLFFKQGEAKAKATLKELKQGKRISLGDITLKNKETPPRELKVPIFLELDYTEFVGPGFSFPVYRVALQAMLEKIAVAQRAKKSLNILTSEESGAILIHQPGVIQAGEHINVLLLTIQPLKKNGFTFRLMFVDPTQYQRKDTAPATPAT